MNNVELEKKILEIIDMDNFFDMVLAAKEFEKEYKNSDFFKQTKMPLKDVIKESKIFYALQLRDAEKKVQALLDNLSLDNVNQILDKIGATFGAENEEIRESLEAFKDLKN